jgi:hypothetical protein
MPRRSSIQDQQAEDKEYWATLGQFIEIFSFLELQLFKILMRFTGVSHGVAKAIFSGTHIEIAIGLLRRTMNISWKQLEIDELFALLAQLKTIAGTRNDMIHFGSSFDRDGGRIISTAAKSLFPEDARVTRLSSQTIDAMFADLAVIMLELSAWQMSPLKDLERENPNCIYRAKEQRAWNYKPDAPSQNRQSRGQNPTGKGGHQR